MNRVAKERIDGNARDVIGRRHQRAGRNGRITLSRFSKMGMNVAILVEP